MISSIIMPYSNFNDTQSIAALYHNCLQEDSDLTVLEFIGEKLLFSAFPEEEDEHETLPKEKSDQQIIHIQSGGVLYQQKTQQINFSIPSIVVFKQPLINTKFTMKNFSAGIFRPPCAV